MAKNDPKIKLKISASDAELLARGAGLVWQATDNARRTLGLSDGPAGLALTNEMERASMLEARLVNLAADARESAKTRKEAVGAP